MRHHFRKSMSIHHLLPLSFFLITNVLIEARTEEDKDREEKKKSIIRNFMCFYFISVYFVLFRSRDMKT